MIKKAIHTLSADMGVFLFSLLTSVIINRALGPQLLGKYFLLMAASFLIVNILSLGFEASSSVLAAKNRAVAGPLLVLSAILSVVVGALTIAAYFLMKGILSGFVLKGMEEELILPVVLSVPFILFITYWKSLLVGLEEITFLNVYNLVTNAITVVLSFFVLVVLGLGLKEFLYATLVYTVLLSFFATYALLKKRAETRFLVDSSVLRESLSLGLKTHLGNIAHYIFLRVDYFLVNFFLGSQALAFYGLATTLAEKAWMIVSPLYTVTFARITASSVGDSVELLSKVLRNIIFLLLLLCIFLGFAGYPLIRLLYGREYLPAYVPMVLLLPGIVFLGASWFLGLFFVGQLKRPMVTTAIAWVGLLISIPLYVGLIQAFGTAGAALASSVTYGLIFWLTFLQFGKILEKPYKKALFVGIEDIRTIFTGLYSNIAR